MAGSLGSSAAVTRAGASVAAAALTCVAYLIGIAGYALLIRTRSPGRDHAGLIDATVISTGVGMLAWLFLASPYSVNDTLPLVERGLSVLYVVLDVLVIALVIGGRDRTPAYLLMTAGWLVLVAADTGRALLVQLGTYDPASQVEAGWLVAYALWGAAVLHPSVATLTDPVPAPRIGLTDFGTGYSSLAYLRISTPPGGPRGMLGPWRTGRSRWRSGGGWGRWPRPWRAPANPGRRGWRWRRGRCRGPPGPGCWRGPSIRSRGRMRPWRWPGTGPGVSWWCWRWRR